MITCLLLQQRKTLLLLILFLSPVLCFADVYDKQVRELIRNRVEAAQQNRISLFAGEEKLMSKTLLPRFYQARAYKAIWIEERGLNKEATEVVKLLEKAAEEGLNPQDYHEQALKTLLSKVKSKPEDIYERDEAVLKALKASVPLI